jgi:hypothetical protein
MENIITTTVELSKLNLNPLNPRRIFNERALVPSLVEIGLEVPIHVRGYKDRKTFDLLRGDRRTRALRIVEREYPGAFDAHFPDGIPCVMHMDISEEEAIEITNDHGSSLSLSNEFEIYLTVEGYFKMGLSERQALFRVQTLLDHILPIKGKAGIEIEDLKQKLDKATKANREERVKAYEERYWVARRGVMQRYTRIYKNPSVVKDAMEFKWLKVMPEGYESDLPILSDNDLKNLSKTFVDEVSEGKFDGNGRPMVTKNNPGEKWQELWKDTIKSKATGEKSDEPRKSKGRKEIMKPLEEGQIESGYMANVIRHHAADKEVDGKCIGIADQLLAVVEVVQKVDEQLWHDCVELYKAYMEEQRNKPAETETE